MNRFRSSETFTAVIIALGLAPAMNAAAECTVQTPPTQAAALAEKLRLAGDRQAAVLCYEIASRSSLDEAALRSTRARLALLYEELGEYDKAHQQLTALLDQPTDDPAVRADLSRRIGWIEYRRGNYPRAEQHLREAALLARETHGAASIELARVLNSLGAVLRDVADYDGAQQTLESALLMAGADVDLGAAIHNNLGGLWYYRGNYRKAVEHYRSALVAFERLQGDSGADVASALSNLGLMYQELGASREALPFMQRALLIKEKLYGPVHASVGSTVNNLARLHAQLGNEAAAEAGFQRALTIYERTLGPNHPNVAHVLHLFGMFRESRGDAPAARMYFERSLAIREQSYGVDSNWAAETLVSLGPTLAAASEQSRAEEVMIRALALAVMSGEDELLWTAFASYARVLARDRAFAASAFYGKHAVNIIQRMRSDIAALGQPLQQSFLLDRSAIYRDLIDWLITLGRLADAEQVMTMLKDEEYFDYVRDRLRGDDSGATRAGFSAAEQVDVARMAAAAAALQKSSAASRKNHGDAIRRQPEQAASARAREQFENAMKQATHALRTGSMAPPSESGDAQAPGAATGRGAVIRYLVRPERTRVLLTHDDLRTSWDIPVESAALNRLVFELRQALQNPRADPQPASRRLYSLLLQPLESTLERYDVETLTLILDGALRYVPFGVLDDGKRYLIERYAIEVQTPAGGAPRANAPASVRIAALGLTQSVAGLPPLPRVRTELERIVNRGGLDRDGVVPGIIVLDQAFTQRQLDHAFGGRFAWVHLASHFVFRPGALTDSWLVLGDGRPLTLASFKDRAPDLSAVELLTLSACSTALADDAGAGRELESFGAIAQRLGARDVLATLWPVGDMSTTLLMTDLYRRLYRGQAGRDPSAQALRQAQLGLLRPASRYAPYRHPFYWAPFVLFASR